MSALENVPWIVKMHKRIWINRNGGYLSNHNTDQLNWNFLLGIFGSWHSRRSQLTKKPKTTGIYMIVLDHRKVCLTAAVWRQAVPAKKLSWSQLLAKAPHQKWVASTEMNARTSVFAAVQIWFKSSLQNSDRNIMKNWGHEASLKRNRIHIFAAWEALETWQSIKSCWHAGGLH